MGKIKIVSLILRMIFTFMLLLLPAYTILYWLSDGQPFGYGLNIVIFPYSGPPLPLISNLTPNIKMLGFLVNMIPISIYMTILYLLTRLFRSFEKQQIFSIKTARYIRYVGLTMLLGQVLYPVFQYLTEYTLTYNLPFQYQGYVRFLDIPTVMAIIVAILIVLVSWIMEEGHRLYEENSYTV